MPQQIDIYFQYGIFFLHYEFFVLFFFLLPLCSVDLPLRSHSLDQVMSRPSVISGTEDMKFQFTGPLQLNSNPDPGPNCKT